MTTPVVPLVGLAAIAAIAVWSLPRWLPPAVIRLRQRIFTLVNGGEGVAVPGPLAGVEHFERVYAHPAADGRSRGAGISDLFWYWLAPGPQMHQEHLEPGARYAAVARTTRAVLAVPHQRSTGLATAAARRVLGDLPTGRTSLVRLRDLMMPIWAEVFYELVFAGPCPPAVRAMIIANADDVVSALKGTRLRHLERRDRLTRYLLGRVEAGTSPVTLPAPFTAQETAWYLQGTFFNTAVVQMSEAMAHLLLAVARHPHVQHGLRAALEAPGGAGDAALDRSIDETLRVFPLFGVAHRISSAPIPVDNEVTLPAGSVLLFDYLAFHRSGPAADPAFDPDRWLSLNRRDAHFIPFGVTGNRACPARGAAPVMMRAVAREVLRRYALASSVSHSRSLPSRGPCYLTPSGVPAPGGTRLWAARLWAMRLRDRWSGAGRAVTQLVLGSWMVVDARRQRLCAAHFEEDRHDTR